MIFYINLLTHKQNNYSIVFIHVSIQYINKTTLYVPKLVLDDLKNNIHLEI